MSLPHTYFWNIAKSSIMVYNGRIYQLVSSSSENATNTLTINGKKYKFEESESLVDLEALYNTDFEDEIDAHKTMFLNEKLKDGISRHAKWKLKSINRVKSELERNQALLIILEKILPEIEGKNPLEHVDEYAGKLPKEEIAKVKEKISEIERVILDELIKRLEIKGILLNESKKVIINNLRDRSMLGKYIFHHFNIVILSPKKMFIFSDKKSDDKVNINGDSYYLQEYGEYHSIDSVEKTYLELLDHTFNFEALEIMDKTIDGLEEIYRQEALLNQIIKGEEFHGTGGGFYRHVSGKIVFYVNFPQFINKFPNEKYVLFPPGKIALGAKYDSSNNDFSIMRDSISVLSRYRHPFTTPFDNTDESGFCIGSYTMKQKMKGYEKIPQVLIELKTLLMSGYNSYLRNSVYEHDYNYISKKEAIKKGIQITNENIVVSENIKRRYEEPIEDDEE